VALKICRILLISRVSGAGGGCFRTPDDAGGDGTIRTDFGASGVRNPELDAYREGSVGMLRRMATAGYAAPGDPAKMAKAIVDTLEAGTAPRRLALGPDEYGYIKKSLTNRLEQLEAHKSLTMSTDCDDVVTG
jgi:hypothetical protein